MLRNIGQLGNNRVDATLLVRVFTVLSNDFKKWRIEKNGRLYQINGKDETTKVLLLDSLEYALLLDRTYGCMRRMYLKMICMRTK